MLPLLGAVVGIVLAQLFALAGQDPARSSWTITVDRARDVLMGWLSIVFAALSIVLALASVTAQNVVGRYSSRVLRIYSRRSSDRIMLAVFAITASFILTSQFRLRAFAPESLAPTGSVVVAFVLLVVSGVTIIWYVSTLIRWFRVDQSSRRISDMTRRAARAEARARRSDTPLRGPLPDRPAEATPVRARRSGYLSGYDTDGLLAITMAQDAILVMERPLGVDVTAGERIGWIVGLGGRPATTPAIPDLDDLVELVGEPELEFDDFVELVDYQGLEIDELVEIAEFQALDVAVGHGIVALVDIAIMALSPAVNDPNSAVRVLQEMGFLLRDLAEHETGPYGRVDADGRVRVHIGAPTFGDRVALALEQIIFYGYVDPAVRRAIDRTLGSLQELDIDDADRDRIDALAAARTP